jgi:predicted tellurium resistance membrane protein TerC
MSESKSSNGISFTGLLTLLFIGLKLTGNVDWSWWWVLSPVWICLVCALALILVIAFFEVREAQAKARKVKP